MIPPFPGPGPFRAPLPPLLARLHALLEAHAEDTEEGVLIIEQDRRLKPDAPPPGLPVIVFVPAKARPGATAGRVAPELIVELVTTPGPSEREARYARNDVREYWRVEPGPPVRIIVHTQADTAASVFRAASAHEDQDPVRSGVLPRLVLRPADLSGPPTM